MARSRNIKPGFYTNEDLAECSIWARYIFPGLWMNASREGILEDRPKRLKAAILPFDALDLEPMLVELHDRCFIYRYVDEIGRRLIFIPGFSTHQSPHYSEKASGMKPPQLPEKWRHQASRNLGEVSEPSPSTPKPSGSAAPIKRGSQPPDSLIPDSLTTPPSPPAARGGVDKSQRPPPASPPISRVSGQWWKTEAGCTAKGNELGIPPNTGEALPAYAERLRKAIATRKAEAEGKRTRRENPPNSVTLPRARESVEARPLPLSWAVTLSLQLRVLEVQPTWNSDHVEDMARSFREVAKRAPPTVDWDEVFVAWCAKLEALPPPLPEPDAPTPPDLPEEAHEDSGTSTEPSGSSELGEGVDALWFEDPAQVSARAVELGVVSFEDEGFGDFAARTLAALGPGPDWDALDEDFRRRVQYFQSVGINSDAARPGAN